MGFKTGRVFRTRTKMVLGIGQYPPEFNPKVHGPYNPATNYGKPDIKLADVKVGELGAWMGRRNYHPLAMGRALGRGYWQWAQKWLLTKKPGFAPVGQFILVLSGFFYVNLYHGLKSHRHVKYHW